MRGVLNLNRKIERIHGLVLESAPALAQFSYGYALNDFHHGFAHFLHHAPDGAARFIGTGTLFVETLADTTNWCESAFDMPNDYRQRDFLRPTRKAIATGNAAFALHDSSRAEVVEDLFEETLGDVLLLRDGLNPDHRRPVVQTEHQQGPQGIFTPNGELHKRKSTIYSRKLKNNRLCRKKALNISIIINLIISIDIIEINSNLTEIRDVMSHNKSISEQKSDAARHAGGDDSWLEVLRQQIASLSFGVVQIVVHDARVVQIERTEKIRLENPIVISNRGH